MSFAAGERGGGGGGFDKPGDAESAAHTGGSAMSTVLLKFKFKCSVIGGWSAKRKDGRFFPLMAGSLRKSSWEEEEKRREGGGVEGEEGSDEPQKQTLLFRFVVGGSSHHPTH